TMPPPTAAVDLVARIHAGERAAERELVERCGATLRFLTRRYTRTEADAEDLYQETLIVALEKIRRGEVREPEKLAGFLRALAKNLVTGQYRRQRYSAERPVLDEIAEPVAEDRADPLADALADERKRLTRKLLDELDMPRDRDVLRRFYLAEQSAARICAELEIDGEHFYRILHRARKRYRRLWDERERTA
ncbi:MAG: sigma-70 family RNA polymerase sigma factor, partial [Acidobacteriota bacterium]